MLVEIMVSKNNRENALNKITEEVKRKCWKNKMKPENISELDWKLLKEKYPNNIEKILKKLEENYPVQYLIGNVEFLNTKILVDERALIPRFETEFLVEKTIHKLKELKIKKPKILELGTGSGCIAIALKKNIVCEVTSIDINKDALELAKKNAKENEVQINLKKENMLNISYEHFDCIISNPPYVSEKEEVGKETAYEPQNAIFALNDGLYYYEEIIKKISKTTDTPKLIAFEIGYLQKEKVKEYTKKYLKNYKCFIEKDLANKDRYAFLIKNE